MPAGSGERSKKGVERPLGAVNGSLHRGGQGVTSRANGLQVSVLWELRCLEWEKTAAAGLLVQRGTNDGDCKMGEV